MTGKSPQSGAKHSAANPKANPKSEKPPVARATVQRGGLPLNRRSGKR